MSKRSCSCVRLFVAALVVALVCVGCTDPSPEDGDAGWPTGGTDVEDGGPADTRSERDTSDGGSRDMGERPAGDVADGGDADTAQSPERLANCGGRLSGREELSSGIRELRALSIALGPTGCPRLGYITREGELVYASWDGETWEKEVLAEVSEGRSLPRLDLAIGSSGEPSIVFSGAKGTRVRHATQDEQGDWSIETVVDWSGEETPTREVDALEHRIAPNGRPVAAVSDELESDDDYDPRLMWYMREEGGWESELVVANITTIFLANSMGFDDDSRPKIAVAAGTRDNFIRYFFRRSSGAWGSYTVVEEPSSGRTATLAFDGESGPNIFACRTTVPGQLTYFWREGGEWRRDGREMGDNTSCNVVDAEFDTSGRLHVLYNTARLDRDDGVTVHHDVYLEGGGALASSEAASLPPSEERMDLVLDTETGRVHVLVVDDRPLSNEEMPVYRTLFEPDAEGGG